MQKFKNITLGLTVFALALSLGGTAFAHYEQQNEDHGEYPTTHKQRKPGSGTGGGTGTGTGSTTFAAQSNVSTVETETETYKMRTTEELRRKASDDIAERRKNAKTKTQEQRQKACEHRKKGLETKFSRISTNTERIQTRIDKILERAVSYADKHGLNNGEIAGLITAANEAKSKSAASVQNLKTLKPTIDCTSSTVPEDVAAFKAAVQEARDNLKAYRTSVKNLLKALIDAEKTTNPTGNTDNSSQGGN